MKALKMGLIDSSFQHHPLNTVPGNTSQEIEWNRASPFNEDLVCFTNEKILSDERLEIEENRRIALLYESRDTMKWLYEKSAKVAHEYKIFFTHEKTFLDAFPNARWIPGNGIWIGNSYGGGAIGIAPKDRMTSFVTSSKATTTLQRLRVLMAQEFEKEKNLDIDVYLRSSDSYDYLPISVCLMRYRFSIVIENTQSPLYFTEKILNCFATGTIPIYLGATKINEFFNPDGIIQFSTKRQLTKEILPMLSSELYDSKRQAIHENLNISHKYSTIEKVMSEFLRNSTF